MAGASKNFRAKDGSSGFKQALDEATTPRVTTTNTNPFAHADDCDLRYSAAWTVAPNRRSFGIETHGPLLRGSASKPMGRDVGCWSAGSASAWSRSAPKSDAADPGIEPTWQIVAKTNQANIASHDIAELGLPIVSLGDEVAKGPVMVVGYLWP